MAQFAKTEAVVEVAEIVEVAAAAEIAVAAVAGVVEGRPAGTSIEVVRLWMTFEGARG